jgi:acyl carrier protein
MTRVEVYGKLEEVLDLAPGTLKGDMALKELEQWDSVAVVSFIAMADSDFGVILPPKSIAQCRVVDDLADLIVERAQAQVG